MKNELFDISMWAGTEASLDLYRAALKRAVDEGIMGKTRADVYGTPGPDHSQSPRLFSKQGEVAIIGISGSLNNSDSWINEYMGSTGYPEIRAALIYAAMQADIKTIVLDIKSGGGAVSGVVDTAELVANINKNVKPIHTYSDGMIASAAYWVGAAASSVTIGKATEAGSIGVLAVHQESSRMLEQAGVTVSVIRSGKWKGLGNSAEPLSQLGRDTLQAQVDELSSMFASDIGNFRGYSAAQVESAMGQGRIFIGAQAVEVGLADEISGFDAFMSRIQGGGIDSQNQQPKYGASYKKEKSLMPRNALTEQQLAAMIAGAVSTSAENTELTDAQKADAEAAVTAAADKAAADATAATAAAAAAAAPLPDNGVIALLNTQLAAAQAQTLELTGQASLAKAEFDQSKLALDALLPIARAAVGNLRIALGGVSAGVEALTAQALIAEHANLAAQFDKKFKAGGVAAVASPAPAEGDAHVSDDPKRRARLDATQNRKPK